ncbi:Glyoxalase domain-containing protein 4 [Trachymyrmex zeteki]|uniref:Glyoxalase domain-containing protein 4 n=2 Tax=Mycetomoellerius zeteki TaxID=64791 RepID=A0A151X7N5_9HYME|nr:Glyoxalase domain-containing protein 4 [Trachymyrmex zeteki]
MMMLFEFICLYPHRVLRHEEFSDGCEAACNGPYANRWSKTMIGYGPEDTHFVIELTYNYGIKEYETGNDFKAITIRSKDVIEKARANNWPIHEEDGKFVVQAPGGYKYYIVNEQSPTNSDPVEKVTLSSSNLERTITYWKDILGLQIFGRKDKSVLMGYSKDQVKLEFEDIGTEVNHAKAYGRIAFSVPVSEQPAIQKAIKENGNKILTDLITLDTPGKASVRVIILADPPSQNYASTSFGQSNVSYNQSQETAPSNNLPWNNPNFNRIQSHPLGSTSTKIGYKDHLRPTSMPIPSAPYPSHPLSHSNQPHIPHVLSMNNPSHSFPSQSFGHISSYPAHIPPPISGTFGNPYSTHPVGGTYGAAGHIYYPQQHVLAQPVAQPYIPGQTVIMVPGQQDTGRGFGQMMKEALVFSTINVGVNRLINPHQHDYSSPSSGTGTNETHITYNNYYFNTARPGSVSLASSNIPRGNVSVASPVNPNPNLNPMITPDVSIPTIVSNGSTTYPVGSSSLNTVGTANNVEIPSVVAPNEFSISNTGNNQRMFNQGTAIYSPQYKISDDDLLMLTEELFVKQEVDISKYLTLHLQSKSENVTDVAKGPLIYVQEETYDYPTILAIRALYDNYEHNSIVKETRTAEKRKREDFLLDMFVNTNVMARALRWLSDRGFIDPDDFERKDTLRRIWFNMFNGATSGFERVFTSEKYGTELLGVQDWIYFNYQESKNRIDYMGYVDIMKLGDRASLVKLNFQMDGIIRPNATIFVGTFPELEMALYTICFYTRPNNLCPVSLGGKKFNIFTHSFRYYGQDVIDLALPIF